jgi:hypothetical protein
MEIASEIIEAIMISRTMSERSVEVFKEALNALNDTHTPYAVGGAFAIYHYTGLWRDTNDLDLYLERSQVPGAAETLSSIGFADYGEMAAGDREWIYHALKNEILVDLIWQTPNHLSPIGNELHSRATEGVFLGLPVRFLPPDILIWAKIFTMNRHRCDWPDIFNVARACPNGIDWQSLLLRMGEHWPVLLSFVTLFDWAYPGEALCIPQPIRSELMRRKQLQPVSPNEPTRESLLDPWIYSRPLAP